MTGLMGRLDAKDLARRFGSTEALRGASLSVSIGEVVALIGPNGSGKTTLLEAIAGQLGVDRGEVRSDGTAIQGHDRRSSLFFLPDGIRPWQDQRLDWVLEMAEGLYGGESTTRAALIERLGLTRLLRATLGTLSKGEHKRTMLALALNTPQPILLLDEPFDGLDLRQTREVMDLMREHARAGAGRGLLVSIHSLTDAARVADRLVLLNAGRVVGTGTLEQLRGMASLPGASLEEVFLALT